MSGFHVDWTTNPAHAHHFRTLSTFEEGHRHVVDGFTFTVNGSNTDAHTHFYRGITTQNNGHYHRFYGETGPPIPLKDGSHYHRLEGRVYYNYQEGAETEFGGIVYKPGKRPVHDHRYKGRTDGGVGYYPAGW